MRNSTRTLSTLVCLISLGQLASAQSSAASREVNFIADIHKTPDVEWQTELRQHNGWRGFVAQHPQWVVEFNEASGMPRRAFGPPIAVEGANPDERAMNFITGELAGFGLPVQELVPMSTAPANKVTYVHFAQKHVGLPVLFSHVMVKLDAQGHVIAFGADTFDASIVDMQPMIGAGTAATTASEGLSGVTTTTDEGLRILPVPNGHTVDVRLVHEVTVRTASGTPGRYQCWVDAHTGALLHRQNLVVSEHDHGDGADDAADVQVNGSVYTDGALGPLTVEGLPDLRTTINGNFLFADANGFLPTGVAGPVSATFQLRGRWSIVTSGGSNPDFVSTLNEGSNTVSFDADANVRERTAYYHVSSIHNHGIAVLPGFTGMDIALPTKVDVSTATDSCNAYYDGASINFYAQTPGCRALSLYGDVIYHEYGHGINDKFYQSQGGANFTNGAMNEGYADVWSLTLTENPVMTLGWKIGYPDSYIRRYDMDPKVYPIDLVGEPHRDGEIIAGAWWDTYRLLGFDMSLTLQLFSDAFPGLQATAANGLEGQAYRDVLLDVLQADDDDGNIANGTPHGLAIVEAFAIHGITLLSNAQFTHTPVLAASEASPIAINATLNLTFPFSTYVDGGDLHYKVSTASSWTTVPLNVAGSNYSAQIPAQPSGTIVAYYLSAQDIYANAFSSVLPAGAQFEDDTYLPFYTLVGFDLQATEDGDNFSQFGNWNTPVAGDNATTGQWEYGVLIGSYVTPGDPNSIVQPAEQHTVGGELCFFTGNAAGPNESIGANDVDGGKTTIMSDPINLSGYSNPVFTYWRWYTNNSGANPSTDWWQVSISGNNGSTWVPVENTKGTDRSWRRKAFRVQEYVTPSANVRIRFVASDSLRPTIQLNGGSLIEAALDDIQLWDGDENTTSVEEAGDIVSAVYPSPANDALNVVITATDLRALRMDVVDLTGRVVLTPSVANLVAGQPHRIDTRGLAEGQYVLRLVWEGGRSERVFNIMR
ncbi:MAG: T9SS type A sorting domain-containing protein [Flavobacteriales bacterium]